MADYEYIEFTKTINKIGNLDGTEFATDTPIEVGDVVRLRLKDPFLADPDNSVFVNITTTHVLHKDGGTRIGYDRTAADHDYRPKDFAACHTLHNKNCLTNAVCDDMPTYTGGHEATITIDLDGEGTTTEAIVVAHVTGQAETEAAILAAAVAAVPNAYISSGTPNQLCMRLETGGTLVITSGAP